MIANIKPLSIRIDQLILRHWCRATYSSSFHPLHKALNKFRRNLPQIIRVNKNIRKRIHQSPFYKAEWIIDTNYPMSISTSTNVIRNPISSLPLFSLNEIPSNYSVELNPADRYQINNTAINFYVDGSCNPNPGMGAYGWYSPRYNSTTSNFKVKTYLYPVTINKCESMAINILLQFINSNPPINSTYDKITCINIYCDSLITLKYLKLQIYPKYNDTKQIIEQCLESL